jgi:hypothetical protein
VTKGKPWTRDQEKRLQEFVKAKVSPETIARELGISLDSVRQKMRRLGLEVVGHGDLQNPTTTSDLPKDLFTVEEVLLFLARAVKSLEQVGLDRNETLRLRSLIQGCRVYQDKFAEYVNYRRIESDLMELRKEVAALRARAKNATG